MDYTVYIKPELLILIPVLIALGRFLKESSLSNGNIPLVLGFTGIVLSALWVMADTPVNIPTAIFTAVIQGILCASAAVYGHQLFKQTGKD